MRSCDLSWLGGHESCLPRLCFENVHVMPISVFWVVGGLPSKSHSSPLAHWIWAFRSASLCFCLLCSVPHFGVLNPGARSLWTCDLGPDMALQNLDV